MRRNLIIAASIFGLALFLGIFFWGIIRLQGTGGTPSVTRPSPQMQAQPQPPLPETPMTTSTSAQPVTRSLDVTFDFGTEKLELGQKQLLRVSRPNAAEPPLVEINSQLAESLVANLKDPAGAGTTEPARLIAGRNGNPQRIARGLGARLIDRERTLMILKERASRAADAPSLTIPVAFKADEGAEGFDAQRQKLGFTVCLGRFETLHADHADDEARNENLRIAAEKCDGLIIQPGEEFNFDKAVGPRVAKNGFKMAGVISNGRVIPGMGGGVCQVSTTLYRTALLANMKITERHNHSIYEGIPYADRGLDAAISWGSKNFRFVNTLGIPLLISCHGGNGRVHVSLYAPSQPFDKVEVLTRNEKPIPFPTQVKKSKKLKGGDKRIARPGVTGYTIDAYRIVTQGGFSREEKLSSDNYLMFPQVEEISN
ncbi:MAG TPA: VanW family protein [Candidatus Ozemobacteraceae bacterium]|nr:VanW family protein [Candidatus Ozemobacteraceae bacterium]